LFNYQYRAPGVIRLRSVPDSHFFNLEVMAPYIPGLHVDLRDVNSIYVGGIWWCPSSRKSPLDEVKAVAALGHFNTSYSYFARVENWKPGEASRPDDLTANVLRADRLLMTDMLQGIPDGRWAYNHGRKPGLYFDVTPPKFSGIHHLYGEGHVIWRNVNKFDVGSLKPGNKNIGWVTDPGHNTTYY
jgi:hypothetical protein